MSAVVLPPRGEPNPAHLWSAGCEDCDWLSPSFDYVGTAEHFAEVHNLGEHEPIDCATCGGSGYLLDGDHPDGEGCADCFGTGRIQR